MRSAIIPSSITCGHEQSQPRRHWVVEICVTLAVSGAKIAVGAGKYSFLWLLRFAAIAGIMITAPLWLAIFTPGDGVSLVAALSEVAPHCLSRAELFARTQVIGPVATMCVILGVGQSLLRLFAKPESPRT